MGSHTRRDWMFITEVNPILKRGVKSPLEVTDLDYIDADRNVEVLIQEFLRLHAKGMHPAKIFYKLFCKYLWIGALTYILASVCMLISPWFLSKIVGSKIDFEKAKETGETLYMPWIWALAMFLSQLGSSQFQSISNYFTVRMALQARTLMLAIVYRQSVLAHDGSEVTEGSLNLIAQDAMRVVEFGVIIHKTWTAPFVLTAGIVYIYILVGSCVFGGLSIMLIFFPTAMILGKMNMRFIKTKMKFSDSRIAFISEALRGMKVVKSSAWELPIMKAIDTHRVAELLCLLKIAFVKAFIVPISLIIPTLASVITFVILYFADSGFDASKAFQVVSIFGVLRFPFLTFPVGFSLGIQVSVSLKRFNDFLNTRKRKDLVQGPALTREANTHKWPIGKDKDIVKEPKKGRVVDTKDVVVTDIETGQEKETKKDFALILPALDIPKGTFVAVVGSVGAGKTAFIRTILGETTNSFASTDRIGYCAQDPFIRHGTVMENIVNTEEWDEERYEDVIKRCQLSADIKLFPMGDATEIGEQGIGLSGGQKARLALARALFSRCDVLLFDDVLAALDPHVAAKITTDVLLHEERSLVLVTQNMDVAKHADFVIYIDNGVATEPRRFVDLLAGNSSFVDFVDACGASLDGIDGQNDWESESLTMTKNSITRWQESFVISFRADSLEDLNLMTFTTVFMEDNVASIDNRNDDKLKFNNKNCQLVEKETMNRGYVSYSMLKAYFGAGTGDNVFIFICLMLTFLFAEVSFVSIDLWLAYWSEQKGEDSGYNVAIYVTLGIVYMFFQTLRACSMTYFGYVASKVLHSKLMKSIFGSPLRFFDETPSGRILNRASKDISDIDMRLPDQYPALIMNGLRVLSIMTIVSLICPIFSVAVIPVFLVIYFLSRYYRFSSRELQRLESVTRSPIFSLYSSSLQGLSTFRAFKWEDSIVEEYERLMDSNVRALYVKYIAELWLQWRLMTLSSVVVGCTSTAVLLSFAGHIPTNLTQGMAGVVLSNSLTIIVNMVSTVKKFAQVEASMNSVERVVEYINLPPEKDELVSFCSGINNETDEFQMHSGRIVFHNVTATYREGLAPTLNRVSFKINAGSLVGICGRTGAGKSTLFLALLRLIPTRGRVLLDGQNIDYIPLNQLRKKISLVPQDPVFFSGTLRYNLDMFGEYTDEELWEALEKVRFKETIENMGQGLNIEVTSGGKNWSAGQRQMICFARALLGQNKILLLDEATSSMDGATDRIIQKVLREEFRNTTRLVIAHRLQTIADVDQVLMFGSGKLERFGGPEIVKQLMNEEQMGG